MSGAWVIMFMSAAISCSGSIALLMVGRANPDIHLIILYAGIAAIGFCVGLGIEAMRYTKE